MDARALSQDLEAKLLWADKKSGLRTATNLN